MRHKLRQYEITDKEMDSLMYAIIAIKHESKDMIDGGVLQNKYLSVVSDLESIMEKIK